MIIADSKDDKCIRRLIYFLEKNYPGISFQLNIGHTSTIEIPDDEIEVWKEMNKNLFKEISIFCNGYTIGWEEATE